ncbi:hypothetical protein BDW02DRAFT_569502 [Decorospora gaudefroyi]|uniref:Uncharacterized protein n=1 Tax=Decorospora gaudefroyi TaxID=184978 RepID=A0A6A5KKI5_9PLEO|nr:hypothetical protein BDW02DRAFT_569502 [Decorospora gaudefroyi]
MARTHSSHTASPRRIPSPQRSPARRPSQDGSQYEMDLDALGLNSTFESTELENSHQPPADRVDTSDIEGPEDFTMNMTYWMTADLPLAQIKSRKEAQAKRSERRMDAMQETSEHDVATEVGDQAMVEDREERGDEPSRTASPARRPNGTTDEREYSTPASERSMENEEKVRSFLSALPDTDMEGALSGTPLHVPRHSFLQVPRPSPPKARSLQPTVEDYDTPRKPTQETVIHHASAIIDTGEGDAARNKVAELHARLEHHEMASRSRITELETILSYTRSELEGARTDNYRHKERISSLEQNMEQQNADRKDARDSAEAELKTRETALESKMHEFREEMRLQNLAKLQNQREEFERQRKVLEESKRQLTEEVAERGRSLEQVQAELAESRRSHEQELQVSGETQSQQPESEDDHTKQERMLLTEQLSSVQARADALQSSLEMATAEARATREAVQKKDDMLSSMEAKAQNYTTRIAELEGHLQTARFEVECAQADVAAKHQLFHTNIELNARLRSLQSELELSRKDAVAREQESLRVPELEKRIVVLQSDLAAARTDRAAEDQHSLHTSALETRISSLQSQLDSAHANLAAKDEQILRTTALESQNRSLQLQLDSTRTNRSTQDDQMLRIPDLEARISLVQSQLEAARTSIAAKDHEALRVMEEREQAEQRFHTCQGRLQSLEAGTAKLRQQLAEAHRDSAIARADAERFEQELDDALERLQDARAEADGRVMDLDKKLNKMKELKLEAENKFKDLRAQHEDVIEGHEAMVEDVRDKAEDAIRKAGALLEQERSDKRRIMKDLKRTREEVGKLRTAAAEKLAEDEAADDESLVSSSTTEPTAKDTEIADLRDIIRRQIADMKTMKSELLVLRKENKALKTLSTSSKELQSTVAALEAEVATLRTENTTLSSTMQEHEALNGAMDERMAAMLSKLMKERARTVIGKRDGQWVESVKEMQSEKELLGKVLMRQWGREEVGVAREEEGERQRYKYQFVKK